MKTIDELCHPVSWRVYWEREEIRTFGGEDLDIRKTEGGHRFYEERHYLNCLERLRNDHTVTRIAAVKVERLIDECRNQG